MGARRKHVLLQILFEGLILTLTGGLLGFLLATILIRLIGSLPFLGLLFENTSGRSDIHLAVSLSALVVSSTILTAVGLIADMIPAVRATRLNPVQAIRSEQSRPRRVGRASCRSLLFKQWKQPCRHVDIPSPVGRRCPGAPIWAEPQLRPTRRMRAATSTAPTATSADRDDGVTHFHCPAGGSTLVDGRPG